jgi:translation initiation factor IF-3
MAQREKNNENKILANREIRAKDVRVIDADGNNIGVVPYFRALNLAQEQGLDLILINAVAFPNVCKIGDLGKYKYDQQKRQHEQDKKTRENRVDVKEVQLRPNIESHDLHVKIKHIKEWIGDGDKVKIVIKFRGREMANQEVGYRLIENVMSEVPGALIEGRSELQGNKLIAILAQGKTNEQKKQ